MQVKVISILRRTHSLVSKTRAKVLLLPSLTHLLNPRESEYSHFCLKVIGSNLESMRQFREKRFLVRLHINNIQRFFAVQE